MTEQRDPLAALSKDITSAMHGHSHISRLEVCPNAERVLRARVLPLVIAAAKAELILTASEFTRHTIVADDLRKALRVLSSEAVKP